MKYEWQNYIGNHRMFTQFRFLDTNLHVEGEYEGYSSECVTRYTPDQQLRQAMQ